MHPARVVATLLLGIGSAAPSLADDGATTSMAAARADEPDPAVAQVAAPAPRWSAGGELDAGGYRISLSRGGLDFGMRFEPRTFALRPTDTRPEPTALGLPALSLELRSASSTPASASSLAARALGTASSDGAVSKVGIEWKPAQSQVFFRGGVGVRLSGDDSVVMRLRKGTLGVYVHRAF